ncbi:hypothetical protein [Sphingomonas koreensis]
MPLKVFSPCIFAPDGIEADLTQRVISGGTSLSNQEDTIATDGGGSWFFELAEPYLDEVPIARAWRALSGYLGDGRPTIVRICDARHQPSAGFATAPHSDGTPFSDGSEYLSGSTEVSVTADAPLRGTTLAIDDSTIPDGLGGGERFSIAHPGMLERLYQITEIGEDGATISFVPPLREAVTAGTLLNFDDPRCVMRRDGDMRSGARLGYAESSGVRFVEHFPGPGGY